MVQTPELCRLLRKQSHWLDKISKCQCILWCVLPSSTLLPSRNCEAYGLICWLFLYLMSRKGKNGAEVGNIVFCPGDRWGERKLPRKKKKSATKIQLCANYLSQFTEGIDQNHLNFATCAAVWNTVKNSAKNASAEVSWLFSICIWKAQLAVGQMYLLT